MSLLSVPTTSALPSSQLVPANHPAVTRILYRLTRPSLLSLVLDWLDERNQETSAPYLLSPDDEDDEQDFYPPASSLPALREIYTDLQARKGSKRDVVDRILEGDWRDGISLYQLAMADMQYLYDHPASQKWTALKIVRLSTDSSAPDEKEHPSIPRFHPATFLRNLQREALPDVKAHYNLDRHPTLPLLILRIFILESPYNTGLALHSAKERATFDASKTFYVAFPDFSPYIYISLAATPSSAPGSVSTSADNKSLRKLMLEGIPKAFSKPRDRFKLEGTSLSAKNLDALVERRGGGKTNAAGGGWGVYAEDKKKESDNPLNVQLPTPESSVQEGEGDQEAIEATEKKRSMKRKRAEDVSVMKRRKLVAKGRFGNSAKPDDGKGIERLDVRLEDHFPTISTSPEEGPESVDAEEPIKKDKKQKGRRSTITLELDRTEDDDELSGDGWRPDVRLTFHGQHVFAGVRELVEAGIVDGEKMPGWMTGEEGVSVGVVKDGRIRGNKGSVL
ncbi:CHL4 family chromosome segregation protein-like protein [Hyaloscypha variabilis F]|uniref:CHL4 family chromosome segregation protein-like protein n=1 Tax=Hyaloscypha variabilis (strain UAMH 11265 / GT02V1 / F) TaxID=1149755 RepID=A0A2J6QUW0_HYAVF|nr:CHL4 family chromosome segregation protein-like protein [Hyaloscypha variabilis F]